MGGGAAGGKGMQLHSLCEWKVATPAAASSSLVSEEEK